jgi:membrane protein DedA with SNARE-associated domain
MRKGVFDCIMPWIEHFANYPWIFFSVIFLLSFIRVFIPMIPLESSLALFTGYLAGTHRDGHIFLVWLALTSGTSLGGIFIYELTLNRGEKLLNWKFVKDQIHVNNLQKAGNWFQRYGTWIIFIGKCVPGMSLVVIFCCGLFRVKRSLVLSAILISNSVYYSGLVFISKFFGHKWQQLSPTTRFFPLFTLLIGVLLSIAVIWFLQRRYIAKKNE